MRARLVTALAALAALVVGGCANAAAPPAGLERFYTQKLDWTSCFQRFQCANLTVPLDYTHPEGRTIQLAVIRAPAPDTGHRIGSLLTNPGGPGGSGTEFVRDAGPTNFGAALRSNFDIVGFDPRGVGQSAPISCLPGHQLDRFNALDTNPTTPDRVAALVEGDKAFADGCEDRSGTLLPFVGTPNAARDMDVLRAALGDAKLNYLGFSYGTYLGAVYAELFPDRVGRAVFDGPLPPNATGEASDIRQAQGFQDELTRFAADCVTRSDCPLGTDAAAAQARLADLLGAIHTEPLPTDSHRALTQSLAQTGVISAMYDSPNTWSRLRTALAAAQDGDGSPLLKLADEYNNRHHGGRYGNENEAGTAVNCLDWPGSVHDPADVRAALPAYQRASPLIGASAAWSSLLCAYWPVPPQSKPHEIHYSGDPSILVIGNTHDPATPYASAQDMVRQLGDAVLLTYNADGHTAYGRGSECVNKAVETYLTQGTTPPEGTTCQPDHGTR